MTDFLSQRGILAQGDVDAWIDLLVIVVLGVFYAVAALMRAAKRKSQEARQAGSAKGRPVPAESWQQRLARKAEELQRAVEAKGKEVAARMERLEQQARTREPVPQPHVGTRAGRGAESGGVAARRRHAAREQQVKEAVSAAGREATVQPTEVLLEPAAPGEPGRLVAAAASEPGYDADEILDASDPDALRKAVLHYEILGKPIGLREPFEQQGVAF